MMLLHSFFLLKSYNDLLGYKRIRLNFFVSLSTIIYRCHLSLGQSQNSMVLSMYLLKNALDSLDITINYYQYGCVEELKFFLLYE